jgi:SAM-dependent methyltransferase
MNPTGLGQEIDHRIDAIRQSLAENPDDPTTVFAACRYFLEIDQERLAGDLLDLFARKNPARILDPELAKRLGYWLGKAREIGPDGAVPPADFREISRCLDSVTGYLLKDQERFLFEKVRSLPDGAVIVELGCNMGLSTVTMAFACAGTNKRIFSVDTFSGNDGQMGKANDFQEEWAGNLRRFGLEKYVTPLRGFTFQVVPDRSLYPPPDFVFIDASHEFIDVVEDFRTIYPYVKEGGFISFHDVEVGWPGPWRMWKDFASHILADHEFSHSLACGRKVPGRTFARDPAAETIFPFAKELLKEFIVRYGAGHPLVEAMRVSLEGSWNGWEDKKTVLRAENRLADAPEKDFHAGLKDMIFSRDGRIDGIIQLWGGLSMLGQNRFEEASEHFLLVPRVSSPLHPERAHPYLEFIRVQLPSLDLKEPDLGAGRYFQAHIRPADTVFELGSGDGALLSLLNCAAKAGVEEDRELRRRSIAELGIDSVENWDHLQDGRADLLISDDGLSRNSAPLPALRQARLKLRPGGRAVFTVGKRVGPDRRKQPNGDAAPEAQALYAWNAETLKNLFSEAGFAEIRIEVLPGEGEGLAVTASR